MSRNKFKLLSKLQRCFC